MWLKFQDKQGEVSDDETVQFKSYLLSLGISDPVTRDTHGSGQSYYRELAKEIFTILEKPLQVRRTSLIQILSKNSWFV